MNASDHIYVHVPFCNEKCAYCAFYSERIDPGEAHRYLDAVERELDELSDAAAPLTIYFGGGTPSILDTIGLARLCDALLRRVSTDRLVEWTVEANPGTLPDDKIKMLREMGVNRISLGAQTFNDAVLERIGRHHDAADIGRTLHAVRAGEIDNVGLDLIACLPGMSHAAWRSTLSAAVQLEPDHVSAYALSIESDSAFGRNGVTEPTDGATLSAIEAAEDILAASGYRRYEISNYAKTGRECTHNLSCWRGEDYLGFGPAAASRSGLRRWTNRPDTDAYSDALARGDPPPRAEEKLSVRSDAAERLVFAFRLSEGVPTDSLQHADAELAAHWFGTLERLAGERLVENSSGRWRLTRRGRTLADHIAGELLL